LRRYDLLVGEEFQGAGIALDQVDEPGRIGKTVLAQGDDRTLGAGLGLFDSSLAAGTFDRDVLKQVLDLAGQRAEPIDLLGGKGVNLAYARSSKVVIAASSRVIQSALAVGSSPRK